MRLQRSPNVVNMRCYSKPNDFRVWHETDLAAASRDVRSSGHLWLSSWGRASRAACTILDDFDMDQCTNEWLLKPREILKNLYGVRIMHTYEKAPGSTRQSSGYTGLFAVICLFASIFLAWALMRTNLVKTGLEMMSSPPVTTGMASNAPVNSVAKP